MAEYSPPPAKPSGPGRVFHALVWSIKGLVAAFRHERSFRSEVLLLLLLAPLAIWLADSRLTLALMLASLLLVLIVELLNSALEALVDLSCPQHHPLAGRAKDIGSAAVFLSLINVLLVWGLLLL